MTRTSTAPVKRCGCGATYATVEEFLRRTEPLRRSDGTPVREWPDPGLVVGNCACGSTICVEVSQ